MSPEHDPEREKARMAIEDAVNRCVDVGMTVEEVRAEFEYAIETYDHE